jgi:ubiquinone biosynthesis protein COQ4
LFGLSRISVSDELLLKAIEFTQTGLPMTFLSFTVGASKLSKEEWDQYILKLPWALQAGANAKNLMCYFYEYELHKDLSQVRQELNIQLIH